MAKIKNYFLFYITFPIVLFAGCKNMENTAFGKFYHNMTARYNVYFNANETMKLIIKTTEDANVDDYNKILDVYQFATDDILKKNTAQSDKVLKKCNKILEKHPNSKWIKDAYFLVGKAYFYKGDYFSAMETFQYIITKYKDTYTSLEAMIWVALCDIKTDKYSDAQAQISLIKSEEKFPANLKKELLLASAFVNIRLENYPSAAESLKNVIPKEHKRNYKTRYIFILAQLYQNIGKLAEAADLYKSVIKRNPNYEMAFNAKIELSRCYDINEEKTQGMSVINFLRCSRDDKNIQYLDQIYFELALLESKTGNMKEMEKYLRLSLEKSKGNQNQKALAFLMLGNYYYEHSNYISAKRYLDSCSTFF